MYNLQEILAPKKAQTVIRFKDLLLALEYYKEFSKNVNDKGFLVENSFSDRFN